MALARAASIDSASRLASPAAPARSASSAARQRASSRPPRTSARRLICASRTAVVSMSSSSTGSSRAGRYSVDPDHDVLAPIPARLTTGGGRLDPRLGHAGLDRPGHAAERLDLVDQLLGRARQARGQLLEVVAAAERVDHVADAGLLGEDQLGVAGDPGGEVGRQRQRLVEGVGVQRLRAAEHCGERLDAWCGSRCCRGPPPGARRRWSGNGCAASASAGPSARTPAASASPTGSARRAAWRSP